MNEVLSKTDSANGNDNAQLDVEIQVVAFKLGNEEYAVDIVNVQDINRLLNITRVPKSVSYIIGVVNLRGNIVPVIDLHVKFSIEPLENENNKRIIVFNHDDTRIGFIVDEVSEVLRLNKEQIEAPDRVYTTIDPEHVTGIAKVEGRLLILLDLQKILE